MALMEQTDLVPQHMAALANANRIRLERAEAKKKVLSGELTVEAALELPEFQGATIAALLKAQRRWGDLRVRKFLGRIPMAEGKLVGTMTERQRATVVMELLTGNARKEAVAAALAEKVKERPAVQRIGWRSERTVTSTHLRLPALTFTLCGVEVLPDVAVVAVPSGPPCLNCKRIYANL